jgi:hypothetical protein
MCQERISCSCSLSTNDGRRTYSKTSKYSICRNHYPILCLFMRNHLVFGKSNSTGATGVAGIANRAGAELKQHLHMKYIYISVDTISQRLSSFPVLSGVRVSRSLVLCVCFVDRCLFFCTFLLTIVLSVLLLFTDSDYPLVILDLRVLIIPLLSSNFSFNRSSSQL